MFNFTYYYRTWYPEDQFAILLSEGKSFAG